MPKIWLGHTEVRFRPATPAAVANALPCARPALTSTHPSSEPLPSQTWPIIACITVACGWTAYNMGRAYCA